MASRSINKAILLGNLTRDPELKYTPTGAPVCSFGIATNRSWTTADGQTKEDVQYHRIVAWNKLAELCAKLLTKGRKVYLEGRLVYRSFTGKDGQPRNITEIVLDDFIVFGDGKRVEAEGVQGEPAKTEEKTETEEVPPPDNGETDAPKKGKKAKSGGDETIDPDDIPF